MSTGRITVICLCPQSCSGNAASSTGKCDGTYLIHFDDGDVEDYVNIERIRPLDENSEAMVQAYIENDHPAEMELIEAFQVFDKTETGTIPAREYLRILTEIGEEADTR